MGALKKMSTFLGYDQDQEYTDSYQDDYYDDNADLDQPYAEEAPYAEAAPEADLRRIVTVKPSTYNEAQLIGENFRDGVPVIVNLTEMNESEARRMVDFCAGLVFGLYGSIERVTNRVYLLTPATVNIEGATSAPTGGFFAQR